MADASKISVEVVFALPERQFLQPILIAVGSSVEDAVQSSGVASRFPQFDIDALAVGIWGKPATRDQELFSGDRVELYRELQIEPREARRQLALAGKTMSEGGQSSGDKS